MEEKNSTISITPTLRKMLAQLKLVPRESYNDCILRLIKSHEKNGK